MARRIYKNYRVPQKGYKLTHAQHTKQIINRANTHVSRRLRERKHKFEMLKKGKKRYKREAHREKTGWRQGHVVRVG